MPDRRAGVTLDAIGWRAVAGLILVAWWVAMIVPQAARDPLSVQPRTLAALALLMAGVLCLVLGGTRSIAVRALAVGGVTLLSAIAPRAGGRLSVGAIAAGVSVLVLPLLLELILDVLPAGQWRGRLRTVLLSVGVGLAIAVTLTWSALLDGGCRRDCLDEAVLRLGWSGRASLQGLVAAYALAIATLLVVCGVRALRPSGAGRSRLGLIAAGGLVAGLSGAAGSVLELLQLAGLSVHLGADRPLVISWLVTGVAAGMGLVALGVAWTVAGAAGVRARVRRLASALEVAPAPGTLGTALAGVLGDPTIRVGYWVPDEECYVDADGEPDDDLGVGVATAAGDATMAIERRGRPIAVVRHRRPLAARDLEAGLGPSALVALDNERLRAVSLRQLRELQSSRRRIVAVADLERRRIERDLHDGAQQRLLAIAIELRLARGAAEAAGETERAAALARVEEAAGQAIETLRAIARGIYPTVLGRAGLVAAVRSLAAGSDIPLEVDAAGVGRLPEPVELAAYSLVTEALLAAHGRGAGWLSVRLVTAASALTMVIASDVAWPEDDARAVAAEDRVGAAGGTLRWISGQEGAVVLEVQLPCE